MPATITSQFRKNNAKNLIANGTATDQSYWIGIGKSDEWPAITPSTSADVSIPYPNSSVDYSAVTLENLISLKKSVSSSYTTTAPRLMITANVCAVGRKYKVYDSGDDACFIPAGNGTTVDLYPCHVSVISGSTEYFFLCVGVFKTALALDLTTPLDPTTVSGSDPYTVFNVATGSGGYAISTNEAAAVGKMLNTIDGYRWVYLYKLAVTDSFNMDHFKCLPSSDSLSGLTPPNSTIDTSYCANIFAIRIDNVGTNYTNSDFKIILHYSGYNATATAVTGSVVYQSITSLTDRFALSLYIKTNGSISYISAPKIPTTVKYITRATISIITTGANGSAPMLLTPILTPIDATKDLSAILPCWYVAFYAKFNPNPEAGRPTSQPSDVITVNDYRQISLIKNPISLTAASDTTADNVDNSMDCLRYFLMSTTGTQVSSNTELSLKIYQCVSGGSLLGSTDSADSANLISAEAHLDYISVVEGVTRVYFHQNYTGVNVKNFNTTSGSIIKFGINSSTTYAYTSIAEPEYKQGTGQVLFVENRHRITRNPNQSEEIKLIIQL